MITQRVQAAYSKMSEDYRRADEIEVSSEPHQRLRRILETISGSFPTPIDVLELGCGTGRYFYCLRNTRRLVGVDVSEEMLAKAHTPVRSESIAIPRIELVCGDVFSCTFEPGSFDFIYSLGMFGWGCPLKAELLGQCHQWLRPGGRLLFDVLDRSNLTWARRIKRRVGHVLDTVLNQRLTARQLKNPNHVPSFELGERELTQIMKQSPFKRYTITREAYRTPHWQRTRLECLASKE